VPQGGFLQYWDNRNYLSQGNVFQHMESGDNGFGSSGPMLIPGSRLLLVGSKAGLVYLLDRETMHAVQEPISPFTDLALQPGHSLYLHSWWGIPMITQAFVFWRPDVNGDGEKSRPADHGYAYAWAGNDRLRQFRFDYAEQRLQLTATADVPAVLGGGNLILSGAGGKVDSGVLWATSRAGTGTGGPEGVVWAFDPVTLELLWRTQTPAWSKFNPPTIVRGRVFVPSTTPGDTATQQVLVYGVR
jgi:outer membrane protein assembly factor BamB